MYQRHVIDNMLDPYSSNRDYQPTLSICTLLGDDILK